jgi:hypothetical protein
LSEIDRNLRRSELTLSAKKSRQFDSNSIATTVKTPAIQAASIFIMLADCFAGLQIDQMHPVAR